MAALAAMGLCVGGLALGALTTAACGGSTSSGVTAAPADGGSASDGTIADSEKPYTLDDVCERTGPLICEIRKPCCESTSGFDQAGCLAHAKTECEKDVAEVRAGRAVFHGDRITTCLPKYKEIFSSCVLTYELLQKHARDIGACEAFEGQLPEGASCERTSQCKPGATANELAGCDDTTKRCQITKLLGEGATCTIGGAPNLCDEGLYCDASFASEPFTGVCKKKTSLGVACAKDKQPFALECGLGNYCEVSTGLCTAGKSGSAACATDLECASVSCVKPDAGAEPAGACAPVANLVKTNECKGP